MDHRPQRAGRLRRAAAPALLLCAALTAGGVALTGASARGATGLPYQDPGRPVATRVADLLSRMSLDDKIGQMTQAERAVVSPSDVTTYRLGSVLSGGGSAPSPNTATGWADLVDGLQRGALATPLGIPILYGVDAVHGDNNVLGSTIFPHNIGLGATRDPALVEKVGRAVAEEVAGAGPHWTFAPCLCVARDDRWGRTYESFGETPDLVSSMTTIVTGLQGTTLGGGPASVLATAKHYVGDGGTTGGKDQGNTQVSEAELRAVHLPPFKAAVDRGVGSIMVSYSSWNGAKLSGSKYLLTDVLKTELGFKGFLVSDWAAIDQLDGATGFTQNEVVTAINAGLDMIMVPNDYKTFLGYLRAAVNAGQIPMTRIDDAVSRILTQKFTLGLFEHPLTDRSYTATVGSAAHRELARQAVRESQVLLRNTNGVLPISRTAKVFVAGKNADDLGNQAGGWTVSWQGASGATYPGTTILSGIRSAVGSGGSVTYNRDGTGIDSSYKVAVAVVGETPYAEGKGDRTSLALDSTDQATLSRLEASGVPVVVVVVSGRPLELPATHTKWAGLIASWLPGSEGAGVADVLFGAYDPTGKLPMTWPSSTSQEPINSGDGKTGLFPFGFGLSYGTTPPPSTTTSPPPSTTTSPPPSTTTSPPPSSTSPPPSSSTSPPPGPAACRVAYKLNDWGSGFTADVTVSNGGATAVNGWSLRWTFAGNQRISNAWNGTVTQSGNAVTVTGVAWNRDLPPGGSASFGFQGSYSGSNARPSDFTLGDTACSLTS
jgi:beta-glucosidase